MTMGIKVIVLDFDGVILDSEGIKDDAFKFLYRRHPQSLDQIINYHKEYRATTRFEKFKYITENILKEKYTDQLKEKLSCQFSEFVFEKTIICPFIDGAKEFLEHFSEKIPLYIASINPQKDLENILKARALNVFFKKVYAIPWKKSDALREILKIESIVPDEAVFIGDTFNDYKAAEETNIPFIGRDSGKFFDSIDVPVCKNFHDITRIIEEMINAC